MRNGTMSAFWSGLLDGLGEGPRLFFAPIVGAIAEARRAWKR